MVGNLNICIIGARFVQVLWFESDIMLDEDEDEGGSIMI